MRNKDPFASGELLLHHRSEQGVSITCGVPHGCVTAVVADVRCSECLAVVRGDWMQTYTGRAFYPLAPLADDIESVDIAHALSLLCRYGGHVDRYYSVAEHCVLMSHAVAPVNALWALLHDATEAYVGDVIRPLKSALPKYREVEDRLMAVIARRFDIAPDCPAEVKLADARILLDERAALMSAPPQPWAIEHLTALGVEIQGWPPVEAECRYLARLAELAGADTRPYPPEPS